MGTTIHTGTSYRITLVAAAPAASLAILSVAGILGIEPRQAATRLATLPTVLAEAVAAPEARRVSSVLTAFGMKVRLDPILSSGDPAETLCDVAIQAAGSVDRALTRRLAAAVGLEEAAVAAQLAGPEGLVLPEVPQVRRDALARALRREKALRLLTSDPQSATYDLIAPRCRGLAADIMRLGLSPCRMAGAVAGNLNRATAHYLRRRAGAGAIAVNRDFQRFDLVLCTAPGPAQMELVNFLATRSSVVQTVPDQVLPLRIDTDLPRRAAAQFVADYAAIGLDVQARLRGV